MKAKYLAGAMLLAMGFVASCSEDEDYSVATGNILTLVETGEASVASTLATTQGRVLDLSSYAPSSYSVGVVYGTNQDPTTAGKRQLGSLDVATGNVTTTLTGLEEETTYYYATFVNLQGKVTRYGDVKSFSTTNGQISLATVAGGFSSPVAATLGARVNEQDLLNVGLSEVKVGFRLAATADDVQTGRDYTAVLDADNIFKQTVSGLLPGTTYYYAAYVQKDNGLVFSETSQFTTQSQAMEYVDMGLSVMWAKWNLGATDERETGGLYGYGDLKGLNTSEWLTQYATGDIAATDNDPARALSGVLDAGSNQKSQLPTEQQLQELMANTTHEFAEVDGVAGMRFTAKNGNSIFLPAAGYRKGENTEGHDIQGIYWTGTANTINGDYSNTLSFSANGASQGMSQRSMGLSIRTVRTPEAVSSLTVDNSKIITGDIEGNGCLRLEIFNLYGAGTADNPPIDVNKLRFSKNMLVTFTLSGINKEVDCYGGLEFAAESWQPALWSTFNTPYDCHVTGDGTYTVWMETDGAESVGAAVFTIDIDGLHTQLGDAIDNVKAEINSIALDVEDSQMQYYIDNSKVLFNNKDGNGTDGRIEIFNEYGDTKGMGVNVSDLSFSGYQIVRFTITGIDGNLNANATKSYNTELSYAADGWWPSWWGSNDNHDGIGSAIITGDGTYTIFAPLDANTSNGAVVWTIEIYGLWKDLTDPSLVKVNIDSIIIPAKQNK